ncbi:MAG: YHS domain-containing protein [Candidatus Aadella gelida]|nr:YHS domain-containing protein [Candidatus Aadella gelida]
MARILLMFLVCMSLIGAFSISFAEEMHDHDQHMMGEGHKSMEKTQDLGICPVMKGKATKEYSYTYEGKIYYFCCPGCIEEFKKDPAKYISKIKEIDLTAYQFGFSPEEIVVDKDDIVKLSATSKDVPHGIYIKEYGINATAEKGKDEKIEFIADKVGEFDIICSIYCGQGHHGMKAKLIVKE